jgi:hypothetical protein
MSWWESVLSALGVILFWPVLLIAGDVIDRRFQRFMDTRVFAGSEQIRRERLAKAAKS